MDRRAAVRLMYRGRILKGIAGFYYVHVEGEGVFACRAKGIFRSQGVKPLVGDDVEIEILDGDEKTGNLERILERKSELLRPAVSNVDQALLVFAAAKPSPDLSLLDRMLIMMNRQGIHTIVCFNKKDVVTEEELGRLSKIYSGCDSHVLCISAKEQEGVDRLRALLLGHTTAVAGPSGAGKSTLINLLVPDADMETGKISEKIGRGRHTTRHSELFCIQKGSYIFDTPGFSSLELLQMDKEELRSCYPEFREYEGKCRFQGCVHLKEPDCAVKDAVEAGKISRTRYESYALLFEELKEKERRKYT